MKSVQKIDLGLTGYDELFMNEAERKENKLPRIYDIPITEIDDFPDHPFKVKIDEDMDQLVQSIKERGIITPVTLRPKEDGRYEIVSGHRRKKACELAGFETVKAEVREMTRDEAIILMVESNLQRSTILPSEKAFSYKMRLEAMKRQVGRPSLENGSPMDNNLRGVKTASLFQESTGDGQAQVYRYIRLTELIPELLDMVDESRIALRPAVELSYLKKEEQSALLEEISYADATPSLAQAIKMKKFSQEGKLSNDVIESIMSEEKPNQKEKINIKYEDARKYIPASVPYDKTGDYIMKALEYYHRYQERQRDRGDARYVTDENGQIHITGLRVGDYVISEVGNKANEKYELPADITVTVHEGKTVVAKFHNKLKPVTDIPKTGDSTNMPLWATLAGISLIGAGVAAFFTFRKKKEGGKHER